MSDHSAAQCPHCTKYRFNTLHKNCMFLRAAHAMQACLGSQPTATPMNIAALTMLGAYVVFLLAVRPFSELEVMVRAHIHGHTVHVKRGAVRNIMRLLFSSDCPSSSCKLSISFRSTLSA
jgi:hypothetical protein